MQQNKKKKYSQQNIYNDIHFDLVKNELLQNK